MALVCTPWMVGGMQALRYEQRVIARGFRYRLDPLPEQEDLLRQFSGVCRLVYNLALEQRATWGRSHRIGYVAQAADLTRLRAEFDWVRAVYVSCQQQALRDLDRAFQNFFAGRAAFPAPAGAERTTPSASPAGRSRPGASTASGRPYACPRSAGLSSATRARCAAA